MSRLSIFLSCLIAVSITTIAAAGPLPGCTYQTWSFNDPNDPTSVDACNSYGPPTISLNTTGDLNNLGWLAGIDGRTGVWVGEPLNIELIIPNNPAANAYKEISLTMDFMQNLDLIAVYPHPVGTGFSIVEISSSVSSPDPDGWITLNYIWQISPNPEGERICIDLSGSGGLVDYITVETCCVPEPATVTLLSLGGLALLRRPKK